VTTLSLQIQDSWSVTSPLRLRASALNVDTRCSATV